MRSTLPSRTLNSISSAATSILSLIHIYRCLIVDETGEELDGDRIMAVCAAHMKKEGKLRGGAFVATILSNMGCLLYTSSYR